MSSQKRSDIQYQVFNHSNVVKSHDLVTTNHRAAHTRVDCIVRTNSDKEKNAWGGKGGEVDSAGHDKDFGRVDIANWTPLMDKVQ